MTSSAQGFVTHDTKAFADNALEAKGLVPTVTVKDKAGKNGSSPMRIVPQLPIEVWENVIDHLWDHQWALRECSLVCRAWYALSYFHFHRWIDIWRVRDVYAYVKMLKRMPSWSERAHNITISGSSDLSALSTAAILLPRKLPQLKRLSIWRSEWQPGTMHADVFLHLPSFSSITRLDLDDVTFPSITVFSHLVCALPGLVELVCIKLKFAHDHFQHNALAPYHNRVKIRSLILDQSLDLRVLRPQKLLDLLAHPCISSGLQRLIVRAPIGWAGARRRWEWQHLLDAASGSLSELRLEPEYSELQTDTDVSTAGLVPSFANNISLQRLWITLIGISQDYDLDRLCSILLSVKSTQLREIMILFEWNASTTRIKNVKQEVKKLLKIHNIARYFEIDNYLSSERFRTLSKIEFALTRYGFNPQDPSAAAAAAEEQWKQQLAPLFPQLTDQGIFHATLRKVGFEKNF